MARQLVSKLVRGALPAVSFLAIVVAVSLLFNEQDKKSTRNGKKCGTEVACVEAILKDSAELILEERRTRMAAKMSLAPPARELRRHEVASGQAAVSATIPPAWLPESLAPIATPRIEKGELPPVVWVDVDSL